MRARLAVLGMCAALCWGGLGAGGAVGPDVVTRGFREPSVRPDGAEIAFVCGGDIWLARLGSPEAIPLIAGPADERSPVWSPGGRRLAFARTDGGDTDVFVWDLFERRETQLTWHEAEDLPTSFAVSGREVIFSSTRLGAERLFAVAIGGGEPRLLSPIPARQGRPEPAGDRLLCVVGSLPDWRRAYRGTGDSDIALLDPARSRSTRLTPFEGADRWPVWRPRAEAAPSVLYVSEESIVANLWEVEADGTGRRRRTHHTDAPARWPSVTADGARAVYEQAGHLWTLDLSRDASEPERLDLRVPLALENAVADTLREGMSGLAVSSSGELVVEASGDLFWLDPREPQSEGTLLGCPIATHPAREREPIWGPNGSVFFVSDRAGTDDLYRAERPDAPAAPFREAPGEQRAPRLSRDGRLVAYLRRAEREELLVADASGGRERVVARGARFLGFDLSPDSDWIAFSLADGRGRGEIFLQSLLSPEAVSFTDPLAHDVEPSWTADGRWLVFLSDRAGELDLWRVDLTGEDPREGAERRAAGEVRIERARLERRQERWSDFPGDEGPCVVLPGGVVCAAALRGERGIWWLPFDGSSPQRWSDRPLDARALAADAGGTIFALDASGRLFGGRGGEVFRSIPVALPLSAQPAAERRQIFLEAWRALATGFHDPDLHLVDWEAARERHERFLGAVRTKEALWDLLEDLAGELGASHVGVVRPAPERRSGELGFVWGAGSAEGGGLTVESVRPGSPAERWVRARGLAPAAVTVRAVEGAPLGGATSIEQILDGRAGSAVSVEWAAEGRLGRDTLTVTTVESLASAQARDEDAYRARMVEALSEGSVRYVALHRLDGFARGEIERAIDGARGVVLDLRGNGGGGTDFGLLDLLARTPVLGARSRAGELQRAPAPARHGPLVVLIDAETSSAAEILAEGLRVRGLAVLVGETTAGSVLGTEEISLLGGARWRVPRTQWTTLDGAPLEGRGVEPDIRVDPDAESEQEGGEADIALVIAVREVLRMQRGLP